MSNNFLETKQKIRSAVIKANVLIKLVDWLNKLGSDGVNIDCDLILHYIQETEKYLTQQYKDEKK